MKRWLCNAVGRCEYVAADTESGARTRCVERHDFVPETVNVVNWPDRSLQPQVFEIYPHYYGISLLAKR